MRPPLVGPAFVPTSVKDVPAVVEKLASVPADGVVWRARDTASVLDAAGERVRYVPVRIFSDALIEGTETLLLELSGSRSDLVVGSPSIVRIKIDPR